MDDSQAAVGENWLPKCSQCVMLAEYLLVEVCHAYLPGLLVIFFSGGLGIDVGI
jgi:hypothetical protein